MQFTANARRRDCRDRIIVGRPNDVRIDCKAAKHSDGDRGTPPADLDTELRAACRPSSVDCSSAATAARANKRRFVNLLQQLAGGIYRRRLSPTRAPNSENLDSLRALIRPVIQVMVSAHQKNAANARKFNVFSERANLGIFYNQFECASKFLSKEFRCVRAVAPPPASFVADLGQQQEA